MLLEDSFEKRSLRSDGVAELDMTTGLPKGLSDVDRPGRGESAVTGHQEDGQVPQGVFISSGRGSRL